MEMANLIPLPVIIPLGMAFILAIFHHWIEKASDLLANLTMLLLLIISISFVGLPSTVYKAGNWGIVKGTPIGIFMVLDGLSSLILLIINSIGLLALIYSTSYMRRYTDRTRYYILFLLLIGGMNGVVLSGDIFNIYVFLEISAIASYALVAFGTEAEELEAAYKYQVMGTIASLLILLSIALLYSTTGTLNMADISMRLNNGNKEFVMLISALFLFGFGLKSAIMPFHAWLPDAHPSAPAPISAMLSGVLIKVIGIYAMLRVFYNVLGIGSERLILNIFLALGAISMTGGALLALGQRDMKRLLAYSSISQIGYIIFSFGLGTPLGIMAGLFHLINHAAFKSLLFLNSGAVVYATETRDLERMGGLRREMPLTAATSLIGSLSISGVPPFSGFLSKLLIIIAAVAAGRYLLALLAIVVSIITLSYYLRMQKMAFFGERRKDISIKEAPVSMCFSMLILAILCVGLAVLYLNPLTRQLVLSPAVEVLQNGIQYARVVLGG